MRWYWRPAVIVVVIAAAAVLWHHLPVNTEIYAPFDVAGEAGTPAEGRNITTTVTGAQITPEIRPENAVPPVLQATGRWVVVDASIAAIRTPGLARVQLLLGPNTYLPTDRVPPSVHFGGLLQPEITQTGAWAFDVAPEVLDANDSALLQVWVGDGRLDSRLEVRIPLRDVSPVASADVPKPVLSAQ
jgi:hypothetical protein